MKLSDCDVLWGFDLPRLGVEGDLQALAAALKDNGVGVVFIDPAYLCLLAGSPELQANNMFQVGPLLMRVARICQEVGATLILVRHTTKPAGMLRMQACEPLELEDLAYSGFQEFARQWLLVNRRQKYEPGSGKHFLWMNIGGSTGHSGCWGIDVEEGVLDDKLGGRRWLVQVRSMEEALKGISEAKERQKEVGKQVKMTEDSDKILKVLEGIPEGETQAVIAKLTGLQARVVGPVLLVLAGQKKVVPTQVRKSSGQGEKFYPAWRLATTTEFVSAKIEEMGLMPVEAPTAASEKREMAFPKRPGEEDDKDWLDELAEDQRAKA